MARLDWEKADRQERSPKKRKRPGLSKRANARAQGARAEFVAKRDIECFVCGVKSAEWGKTGINKRGPWAICLPCVKSRLAPSE
jgi:hypothetical protein